MARWWPWKRDGRKPKRETVVLGTQLAAARVQEQRVRARQPDVPSPLHARYDFWAGETDLARFVDSPVDNEIASFVEQTRGLPREERERIRTALTMEDFYTLLMFASRASVHTLRKRDQTWAERAGLAIAIIDIARVDERDAFRTTALLAHAVRHTGVADIKEFRDEALTSLFTRIEEGAFGDNLCEWGYAVITSHYGPGLADCGLEDFAPTRDLTRAAIEIADVIDADQYRTSTITIGDSLPEVWFPERVRTQVKDIVAVARAGLSVTAERRPGDSGHEEAQHFVVFLIEVNDPASTQTLAEWSGKNADAFHAAMAIHCQELFLLLVARSFVQNKPAVESHESLERFRTPFTSALEQVL